MEPNEALRKATHLVNVSEIEGDKYLAPSIKEFKVAELTFKAMVEENPDNPENYNAAVLVAKTRQKALAEKSAVAEKILEGLGWKKGQPITKELATKAQQIVRKNKIDKIYAGIPTK